MKVALLTDGVVLDEHEAEVDEAGMEGTFVLRVETGHGDYRWRLEIEVGEWNGLPRVVRVETVDAELKP